MNKLGDLKKKPDGYELRLERVYNHSRAKVWDALTNPTKMSLWFTDVEWDFKPGGKITFIFQDEARTESYGHFVLIEAPRLLEFIWESEDDAPSELARWELFEEEPNKTRLVLTYSRLTEDLAINVATGWHAVVDDLGDYLNGRREFDSFGAAESEGNTEIKAEYTKLFNQLSKNQ